MIFHCLVRVKREWKESGVDGAFHPVHHFFFITHWSLSSERGEKLVMRIKVQN